MKKGTKIIVTCAVAAVIAVGGLFIWNNRTDAGETEKSKYAQGIDAGSDTATVDIDIEE
jgi:hypothetical protein